MDQWVEHGVLIGLDGNKNEKNKSTNINNIYINNVWRTDQQGLSNSKTPC